MWKRVCCEGDEGVPEGDGVLWVRPGCAVSGTRKCNTGVQVSAIASLPRSAPVCLVFGHAVSSKFEARRASLRRAGLNLMVHTPNFGVNLSLCYLYLRVQW